MLSVSLSPCRRSHPAGVVRRVSQYATAHAAFAFPVAGSASGAAFRGHCAFACYSQAHAIPQMVWSRGFGSWFPVPLLSEPGLWLSPRVTLLNTLAFPGHTTGRAPSGIRLSTLDCSPWRPMKRRCPWRQFHGSHPWTACAGGVPVLPLRTGSGCQAPSWWTRLARAPTLGPIRLCLRALALLGVSLASAHSP